MWSPAGGPGPVGPDVLGVAGDVLGAIRRAKTQARRSMRAGVSRLAVVDTRKRVALLRQALTDVQQAGGVATVDLADGDELDVTVELEEDEPRG